MNADPRKPLRILHTEASTGWGGQEIRILDESAGLRARGHDVRIAVVAGSPIANAAERRQIPLYKVPIGRRNPASLLALYRVLATFKPDVVVTHSSTDSWLVSLLCGFRRSAPGVVRTRHLGFQVAGGLLNRWLYGRAADYVVTTGEATRSMLIQTLHLNPQRVVSVPTGIDVTRYRPGDRNAARSALGLEPGAFIIGIVATLRSGKGHRFLVSALADPKLAQAILIIVGDGPQERSLRKRVAELDLTKRVVFAGRQPDVVPWLQACDAFVLPSTAIEGAPQALMQAMACGLPVVTTPMGAIPELVQDGVTGLFVPPGDTQELVEALYRIQRDKIFAAGLGNAARKFAETKCTMTAMLDSMENIFLKISS